MTHDRELPTRLRQLAETTCTPKELEALILWNRGAGYRRVADQLGISVSTARDRIDRATRKLHAHPEAKEYLT